MLERRRFGTGVSTPAEAAVARALLPLLLAHGGSTTRLCETIAGGPIELHVLQQRACNDPPESVRCTLPGMRLIERFSCLASRGAVMLDSLVYVATQTLPRDLAQELEGGERPIGHLLERLWIRRAPWARLDDALCAQLWAVVGSPDASATRTYAVETPDGPLMVITETFRDGMLMSCPVEAGLKP